MWAVAEKAGPAVVRFASMRDAWALPSAGEGAVGVAIRRGVGRRASFIRRYSSESAQRAGFADRWTGASRRGARPPAAAVAAVPRLALNIEEACAALGVSWDFWQEHIAPDMNVVRRRAAAGDNRVVAVDRRRRLE